MNLILLGAGIALVTWTTLLLILGAMANKSIEINCRVALTWLVSGMAGSALVTAIARLLWNIF